MSEWKEIELGELCQIKGGKRLPKGEQLSETPTDHPYIRTRDLANNKIAIQDLLFVPNEVFPKISRYIVEDGDIIISIVGTIGLVARVPRELHLASLTENCAKLVQINEKVLCKEFLFYFLISRDGQEEIDQRNVGSTQPKLPLYNIKTITIPIPPIENQKAIASILSSLDDKIDLLHRQNQTLEQMAETLFRQWFVEEADEDWEKGVLGDVIEIFDNKRIPLSKMQRNKMKDGELYPYYGAASIMDYVNDYLFDGEYILLGEDGTVRTDEGYPVLQYATGKFWVNNHAHILKAKEPYNNFFIWNYLSKKNIDRIVTGAVQPKINQGNLKSLDFPKFPSELVERFNEQMKPTFGKINHNRAQIRTLTALRDTLLPKLMSGEIRIKTDA